jgi:hypothetical protein
MSEPTPFALSHHLTELLGCKVTFTLTTAAADGPTRQIYGIYSVLPNNTAIVVKADLPLLGSFAGVLVGLPDAAVKERMKVSPIDEVLRDAMYEVLNISSAVVATGERTFFIKMVTDKTYVDGAAAAVLLKPGHRSHFSVTVDGYQGGKFAVLSPLVPQIPRG